MKKEKTVRTYQRRTKNGKIVTVRQHTAKYDAAEKMMEAAKKKGAGSELEEKMKKNDSYEVVKAEWDKFVDNIPQKYFADAFSSMEGFSEKFDNAIDTITSKAPLHIRKEAYNTAKEEIKKLVANDKSFDAASIRETIGMTKDQIAVAKGTYKGPLYGLEKDVPKKTPTKQTKTKMSSSEPFTAADFKKWYHWDTENDPKNEAALRVEKALKKSMGAKGYKKFYDSMTDGWSARGHLKAFKSLSEQKVGTERVIPQKLKSQIVK